MIFVGKNNSDSETKEDHFSFGVKYQLHSVRAGRSLGAPGHVRLQSSAAQKEGYTEIHKQTFKKLKSKQRPLPPPATTAMETLNTGFLQGSSKLGEMR